MQHCKMSECLLFNVNSTFSLISLWEQANFQWDDDEVRFALDQHALLDFHRASSLMEQSADRQVGTLGHNMLIPSQPIFTVFP